jgi:PAS domain S-box-containing protein
MTETQPPYSFPFRTATATPEETLALYGPEQLANRLRAIQTITDAALAHLKVDALLKELLWCIRETLQVDAVRVLLYNHAQNVLTVRASLGLEDAGQEPFPVPIGQGIAGWAAYHRQGIIVDDLSRVEVVNPLLRQLSSAMVVPLLVEGELLGVLKVGATSTRTFSEGDLGLLQMVADRVALAVDRAHQYERAVAAEQRLAEKEQLYRSLVDNNPAAVFALEPAGTITSLNPASERISGYAPHELLGDSFLSLVVPEEHERTIVAFQAALRGEAQHLTTRITHKQGHPIDLSVKGIPITRNEEVVGVYCIAEDVTEQRRHAREQQRWLEEQHTKSAQLEAVLRQMPAGVLIAEAPSGRLLMGNAQVEEILRHEFVPTASLEEYSHWSGLHPDGTPVEPPEWPLARAIANGETVTGEEILYRRGDGTRVWIRVSATPIRDAEDRIVAGVMVFHDVSREKRATENLRFLADISSLLQSSLDQDETLRQVAHLAVPRFADWCVVDLIEAPGQAVRHEVAHHDPAREELMQALLKGSPANFEAEHHPIGRVLRTGEPLLIREVSPELLESIAQDAEHLRIIQSLELRSAILVPLQARERTLGAITFATADSGRRYTEEDLELATEVARRSAVAIENAELYAAAAEADRAKADFLAVMSHELRTPLAAIMGYAELLQMGIPTTIPRSALKQVERIDAAARHQLQLIEEILTFSRLSSGDEVVTRGRLELTAPVREAVELIRLAAEKKGLVLQLELPDAPLEVETDAGKIRQILVNLLFNAVQFTRAGEIGVTLKSTPDAVQIDVWDNGIGIARDDLDRIFEPFWQVRQSITREVGGPGLGLTVAQRTAHLLGGTITVESVLDQGTTFSVRLPLRK